MKRQILILYTGGTIGMTSSAQGYVPDDGFEALLKAQLDTRPADQLPDYQLLGFEQLIDSANLTTDDWSKIGQTLLDNWNEYDGFIVLHGTDTMAYTASALSFILQGMDKPVIVTGSQVPLSELRNDALDNLVTSMMLAGNYKIPEVCVYFNGRLLRGNRSKKTKSTGFDAFDSPNFPWLGEVGINIGLRQELILPPEKPEFELPVYQPDAVVMVQTYPGIPARIIDSLIDTEEVRALILQSYGVGNPPDKNQALIASLEKAAGRGIVVVNLSQCYQGSVYQGAYATGATLNRLGVVPGADLTLEASFAKLHHLIGLGYDAERIRQLITTPLAGECSVADQYSFACA
ncbi:L-asparaginase [Amphritea atlantica]|uniref:asparaginase n=1 Tax=Amphritea atlantica TaxID=355243 RepID=A0A1H9E952_9GAMM|nr:asparaginase [Amphritea atlantica]SEQ22189.1 L-asparaginase [Amphritea atlantica]